MTFPSVPEPPTLDPQPRFAGVNLAQLWSYLPNGRLLTGMLRDHFSRHFTAEAAGAVHPQLSHLLWSETDRGNILIESSLRWRPTMVEVRPAIIIKRNAQTNTRMGVGDRLQGNASDRQGNAHFATYWVGSHTLFCIGGGEQAEVLSIEVQAELTQFGPQIQEFTGLKRWQVTEIGAVGILEEHHESFVVPVTVGYAYEEKWAIRQEAPRLNAIELATVTKCLQF